MTGVGRAGAPPSWVQPLYPAVLLSIPMLGLAVLGPGARWAEIAVALVGIVLSSILRILPSSATQLIWAIPSLLAVGVLALTAGASLPSELLAGAAALAALYWIATDVSGVRLSGGPAPGLLLPGLTVALAVSVTLFLPAGPALVGVASVILVALFFGLAAVLGGWANADASD